MTSASGKASTSWTPSSLAGKALGFITGGAEHRKLRYISTIFPHDDNTNVTNIWEVYGNALDGLRPGRYPRSVQESIAKVLLTQIRLEQTLHLRNTLRRLVPVETQHVLSAIMNICLNDIERRYDNCYRQSLATDLTTTTEEAKALVRVLQFTIHITTQNEVACRTVIDAGILDILLRIYVIFPSFSRSSIDGPEHWLPLLKACQSTLLALSQFQTNEDTIFRHPVCAVWRDCRPYPPSYSAEPPTLQSLIAVRCRGWRQATRQCVKRRLLTIAIDCLWQSNVYEIEDLEACADIVEFTQSQFYESDIVQLAILTLLKLILLNGDSAGHLITALSACSVEVSVCIYSGIMLLWLEGIEIQLQNDLTYSHSVFLSNSRQGKLPRTEPIDVGKKFYDHEKTRLFEKTSDVDAALYKFIIFATEAARMNNSIRRSLVDSGALSLVIVAFTNANFIPSQLMDAAKRGRTGIAPSGIPLDVIHAEAATLSVLMHDPLFRKNWREKQLTVRLRLCSSLVDALIGSHGQGDDGHVWTRSLFRKIVA